MKKILAFLAVIFVALTSYCDNIIDVLVLYDDTYDAKDAGAKADNLISGANAVFYESTVSIKLNRFALIPTSAKIKNFSDEVTDIKDYIAKCGEDTLKVSDLRECIGADIVVLITKTKSSNGSLGCAYLLKSSSGDRTKIYSVFNAEHEDAITTFTHEISHNFGLAHSYTQKHQSANDLIPALSYGVGFQDYKNPHYKNENGYEDYRAGYCTIMAYEYDGGGGTVAQRAEYSSLLGKLKSLDAASPEYAETYAALMAQRKLIYGNIFTKVLHFSAPINFSADGKNVPIGGQVYDSDGKAISGKVANAVLALNTMAPIIAAYAEPKKVYYVSPSGKDTNIGRIWGHEFKSIQMAIDAAAAVATDEAPAEVWIKCGTYAEGKPIMMRNNVAIYGGFAGTEKSLEQKSKRANGTIISGENKYNVFHQGSWNPVNSTAILDSVTVTKGHAYRGGGMYNYNSCPLIRNCIFKENYAEYGAGINGNVTVIDSSFIDNYAAHEGGGIRTGNSVVINCVFYGNHGGFNWGGGMHIDGSAVIINSTFRKNKNKCIFIGNGDVTIRNCTIKDNIDISTRSSGGIWIAGQIGVLRLINTILWGNKIVYFQKASA